MADKPVHNIFPVNGTQGKHYAVSQQLIDYLIGQLSLPKYDPRTPHSAQDVGLKFAYYAGQKDLVDKLLILKNRETPNGISNGLKAKGSTTTDRSVAVGGQT